MAAGYKRSVKMSTDQRLLINLVLCVAGREDSESRTRATPLMFSTLPRQPGTYQALRTRTADHLLAAIANHGRRINHSGDDARRVPPKPVEIRIML